MQISAISRIYREQLPLNNAEPVMFHPYYWTVAIDAVIPLAKVAGIFPLGRKLLKRDCSNMTRNLGHPDLWFVAVKGSLCMTTLEV